MTLRASPTWLIEYQKKAAKRKKFGNVPTGGFASKREAARACELELMERAGQITNLRAQVRYELLPKQDGERSAHYTADFVYIDCVTGAEIVEDAKGCRPRDWSLIRKLMLFQHGIKVREV